MRKIFLIIFSLFAVTVLTVPANALELEEVEIGVGVVTGIDFYNLRSAPSYSGSIITKIPCGASFSVYEDLDGWWRVGYNGYFGYIIDGYFDYTPHTLMDRIGISTSCDDETYKYKVCSVCNYSVIVEVIPAKGHDLEIWYSGVNGGLFSCETGGIRSGRCLRLTCDYTFSEVVPPGHKFMEVSRIDPTYHSTGTITNQCDFCGHREYITIPVLVDDGMSEDVYSLGSAFMSGVWKLFGVYVPGFGFTFGGLSLGILTVSLSLSVIYMIFGFGRRGGAVSSRSGSTNKAKISKERENDDH